MTSRSPGTDPGGGQRGLTLLELVITLALLAAVLGGGIYAFVATGTRSARETNDFVQSQAQLRAALDGILEEARWAQSVQAATATSVTLLIPAGTPFNGGAAYTVIFAYDAAADTVTRQVPPGAATPVAFNIVQDTGADGLA
ncbi:MAG: PulJ/GspJ family protein, partial [Gemmatimonadales bacterium]